MRLLLDTQVLLWAAIQPKKLSAPARRLLTAKEQQLAFSVVSLWEIVIKRSLGRRDFTVDAAVLRRALLENGYEELAVSGEHVMRVSGLPAVHKNPFDRLLVAQAQVEGAVLLSSDRVLARYGESVKLV